MKPCKCSIDACDEPSESIGQKIVTAKKEHFCMECGKTIRPGEKYERAVGKCDGEFFTQKTCAPCAEVRDCFLCSYYYERVWEHIQDEADTINLHGLELISAEARAKFFDIVDLREDE